MAVRYFALVGGIIYALVGIAGLFPAALQPPPPGAPVLTVDTLYGYLLGLFPVNVLHSLVHLALGLWGIAAYRSFTGSRGYARGLAWIYGVLTVMGLIPMLNTTFGLIPLFGHDIWLHAGTALIAAYFGYMAPGPARARAF
jgi:hypothetical protein